MPFQVIFSVSQVPSGEITFFTAGDNQSVVCGTQIALQATIIGNTTGHTLEWEGPISGSSLGVTVTDSNYLVSRSPDTLYGGWSGLELYYTNASTTSSYDDKVWRFWIDRGKSTQRYDDITIFGTPTSQTYTGRPEPLDRTPRVNYTNSITGGGVGCRRPELQYIRGLGDGTQDAYDRNGTADYPSLIWTRPCIFTPIIQYVVQERTTTGGPWVSVATLPKDAPRQYRNLTLGSVYRVAVVTQETNSSIATYISHSVYADPDPYDNQTVIEKVFTSSSAFTSAVANDVDAFSISSYSVYLLTRKIFSSPDDFVPSNAYSSNVPNTAEQVQALSYSTTLLTLKSFVSPDDFVPSNAYSSNVPNTAEQVQALSYSVLDLTGGAVGG